MRTSRTVLVVAALLAAASRVKADGGDPPSLLERLSAETADLTAKGEAHTVLLTADDGVLVGVLVGEPARLVVAIDDVAAHGKPPRAGKVALADGTSADARLLDADGELGLAVYALETPATEGAPRAGLALAPASALRRGALAVEVGSGSLDLVVLDRVGGALDDFSSTGDVGVSLLAPGGRLLGLRSGAASGGAASCAACHSVDAQTRLALPRVRLSVPVPSGAWTNPSVPAPAVQPGTYDVVRVSAARTAWGHGAGGEDGFADVVPATVIERALTDVARDGRLAHPYLGVVTEDRGAPDLTWVQGRVVDPQGRLVARLADPSVRAEWLGAVGGLGGGEWHLGARLPRATVRLVSVLPDSPAARAGLAKGQEIEALDGRPFGGARGFARALARRRPGETVTLTIQGQEAPVPVVLGDREKEGRDLASAASVGLEIQTLGPDLVAFLGLAKDTQGVVVRRVAPGSAAATAGLQRGDVLLDGGNGPIRDAEELDAVLGAAKEAVLLGGRRGERQVTFTLTLPAPRAPQKAR